MIRDWWVLPRNVLSILGLLKGRKMTRDNISRIEHELDIRLPADYIQTFLDGSAVGKGEEIYDDSNEIIRNTKRNRDEGFFGLEWPAHYLDIGSDGAGNDYFIDLSTGTSAVYFVDHEHAAARENWEITEEAPSFAEWIKKVEQMQEEYEAWEKERESRDHA